MFRLLFVVFGVLIQFGDCTAVSCNQWISAIPSTVDNLRYYVCNSNTDAGYVWRVSPEKVEQYAMHAYIPSTTTPRCGLGFEGDFAETWAWNTHDTFASPMTRWCRNHLVNGTTSCSNRLDLGECACPGIEGPISPVCVSKPQCGLFRAVCIKFPLPAVGSLVRQMVNDSLISCNGVEPWLQCEVTANGSSLTQLNYGYRSLGLTGAIPACIGNMTALRSILLGQNQLNLVPTEIGQLMQLTNLDLNQNLISDIPAAIWMLTNLVVLQIGVNRLGVISSEIGRLQSLRYFVCGYNPIGSLPGEIRLLKSLTTFSAHSSQLLSMPNALLLLTRLQVLHLAGNFISVIPNGIGQLLFLSSLQLQSNRITSISPELRLLTALADLKLSGQTAAVSACSPSVIVPGCVSSTIPIDNDCCMTPSPFPVCLPVGSLARQMVNDSLIACTRSSCQVTTDISSLTQLNYGGMWLTGGIPSCIGDMTALLAIRFTGNRLTYIPTEIGQLMQLTYLDLNYNLLAEIPSTIWMLTNLVFLQFGGNRLGVIATEIGSLQNLQYLVCAENPIGSLPTEIGLLTSLTTLSVSSNQLGSIPPALLSLTRLKRLYMSGNFISVIPNGIGQLLFLNLLELSFNRITSISPELRLLTALTRLKLSGQTGAVSACSPSTIVPGCVSSTIPIDNDCCMSPSPFPVCLPVGSLSRQMVNDSLIACTRSSCQVTTDVSSLTQLIYSNMGLTGSIPSCIGEMSALTSINFGRNRLKDIPTEIGRLRLLAYFNIMGNQILEIPSEIGLLTNLVGLFANLNLLAELPVEIGLLSRLTAIIFDGNRLKSLPEVIFSLPILQQLTYDSNLFVEIPTTIGSLFSLRTLSVRGNQIRVVPSEIGLLSRLTALYIGYNLVNKLPSEIGLLQGLKVLLASQNRISSLSTEIFTLKQLQRLDVSNNWITSIPSHVGQLVSLTSLELQSNRITRITPELSLLTGLKNLKLSNQDGILPVCSPSIIVPGCVNASLPTINDCCMSPSPFPLCPDAFTPPPVDLNGISPVKYQFEVSGTVSIEWIIYPISKTVRFTMKGYVEGVVCLGISPHGSLSSHYRMDVYCGHVDGSSQRVVVDDMYSGIHFAEQSKPALDNSVNLIGNPTGSIADGFTTIQFVRPLVTGDQYDTSLDGAASNSCFWSLHHPDLSIKHFRQGAFTCNFASGARFYSMDVLLDCNSINACGSNQPCLVENGVSFCDRSLLASNNELAVNVLFTFTGILVLWLLLHLMMKHCTCCHKKASLPPLKQSFGHVLTALVKLFDFATDCMYCNFLYQNLDRGISLLLFLMAMGAIVVPVFANLVALVKLSRQETKQFWRWFEQHAIISCFVFAMSTMDVSMVRLLSSRLLGLQCFHAPMSANRQRQYAYYAIISNVLEDAPQFVIQLFVAIKFKKLTTLSVLSLSITVACLVFGILQRCLVKNLSLAIGETSDEGVVTGGAAHEQANELPSGQVEGSISMPVRSSRHDSQQSSDAAAVVKPIDEEPEPGELSVVK